MLNLSTTQINTKKMGDNEKTILSSMSAATLLKVNSLINTLMPITFVNLEIFLIKISCFSQILNNEHYKKTNIAHRITSKKITKEKENKNKKIINKVNKKKQKTNK